MLSLNDPILILREWNCQFWQRWVCSVGTGQPLHCWSHTLKSAFARSRKIAILKVWNQCLLFVQSYLENFLCHQAAAVPVLPTDNLSPVCRYITEIWPVLMACTWKNRVLLAAFWVKISIFHFGPNGAQLMIAEIFFLRVSQQALQLHSFYPAIFYRCFAVTFPF